MDEKKHAAFFDSQCKISREVGGKFSCYGGYIEGKNLKLVQDKKIVQKWRGKEWPEGHFSEATFEFKKIDGGKTELLFTQTNDQVGYIEQGWYYHYWCKMEKYFKRS